MVSPTVLLAVFLLVVAEATLEMDLKHEFGPEHDGGASSQIARPSLHRFRAGDASFDEFAPLFTEYIQAQVEEHNEKTKEENGGGRRLRSDIVGINYDHIQAQQTEVDHYEKLVRRNPDGDHNWEEHAASRLALHAMMEMSSEAAPRAMSRNVANQAVAKKREICEKQFDNGTTIDTFADDSQSTEGEASGQLGSKYREEVGVMGEQFTNIFANVRKYFRLGFQYRVYPSPALSMVITLAPLRKVVAAVVEVAHALFKLLASVVKLLFHIVENAAAKIWAKITGAPPPSAKRIDQFKNDVKESNEHAEKWRESLFVVDKEATQLLCQQCDLQLKFSLNIAAEFWNTLQIKIATPPGSKLRDVFMWDKCKACVKLAKDAFRKKDDQDQYFRSCNPHSLGLCTALAKARVCSGLEANGIQNRIKSILRAPVDGAPSDDPQIREEEAKDVSVARAAKALLKLHEPGLFEKKGTSEHFSLERICQQLEGLALPLALRSDQPPEVERIQCVDMHVEKFPIPPLDLAEGCRSVMKQINVRRARDDNCLFLLPQEVFADCSKMLECGIRPSEVTVEDVMVERRQDRLVELQQRVEQLMVNLRMRGGALHSGIADSVQLLFDQYDHEDEEDHRSARQIYESYVSEHQWRDAAGQVWAHPLWRTKCMVGKNAGPRGSIRPMLNGRNQMESVFWDPINHHTQHCQGSYQSGEDDLN